MLHAFLSYRPKSPTLHITIFVAALLLVGLTSVFLIPQTVHAGGVSGGGSGGGTANGYKSAYGWGWTQYSVAGRGPTAYSSGTPGWGSVGTTCRDANSVIMFVALNKKNQAAVYKDSGWEGPPQFSAHRESGVTADGGTFISSSAARGAFNSLPSYGVSTSGYTFGKNVAWFCWDFKPQGYSLSATSTADHATAKPGDTIKWTHVLKNDGPAVTSQSTHSNVSMSGFSNGWPAAGQEYSAGDNGAGTAVGTMRTISGENSYVVQQADVGNSICEWMQYSPTNSTGGTDGRAAHACVSILYSYALTPGISLGSWVVESGGSVNLTSTVLNTGATKSQPTQWQVTKMVVTPGGTVPSASGGTTAISADPCGTYFKNSNTTCSKEISGSNLVVNPSNSPTTIAAKTVDVGDYPVGTKVCFATSVQPYTDSSTDWKHSSPVCLTVGIKPKVQILGNDLLAQSVNTSTSVKNFGGATNYTFGSWIEYGIFAVKTITGAASGSAYAGIGLADANSCKESQLSFNNSTALGSCPSTAIGNYTNSPSIPDVGASFPITGSTTQIGGGDLSGLSSSGVFTSSGVTLSGGNIQKGRWVVINAPSADITINGDITYNNGTLNSLADIPQVVIIANNINITGNVKQIDAWLIAKNSLYTCTDQLPLSAPKDSLSSSICGNQLIVNGPVMASQLYLRRTAGSGTGADHSGDPAEIFNLRPDAYMWASLRATGGGSRVQTVYTTELPPRL